MARLLLPTLASELKSRVGYRAVVVLLGLGLATVSCKPEPGRACKKTGVAACESKTTAFVCLEERWAVIPCQGEHGCSESKERVVCDDSRAEVDALCTRDGNLSCSKDLQQKLKCEGGKWQKVSNCLGPGACSASDTLVTCDDTVAAVGDPCAFADSSRHHSCDKVDPHNVLVCKGGKFASIRRCAGECRATGSDVLCQ
jgi:hypothetical protein